MYKLDVSAPAYLSFYGVWGSVGCWLKNRTKAHWSNNDTEVMGKIVKQACKIKHLQMFKQDGMEIVPVDSKDEADYVSKSYGTAKVVYDIGGGLTKLQESLAAGPGSHAGNHDFGGSPKREYELRWGVKIRLLQGRSSEVMPP